MMKKCLRVVAVVLTAAACSENPTDATGSAEATETWAIQFDTLPLDGLRVQNLNGSVTVSGRDSFLQSVTMSGLRRVRSVSLEDAQAHLEDIEINIGQDGRIGTVTTGLPADGMGREYSVDYTISLPDSFTVEVNTTNGNIEIHSVIGDVVAVTTNGGIALDGLEGSVRAQTTNGSVDAVVSPPEGAVIDLRSTNGSIELALPVGVSTSLSARTTNGSVTLSDLTLTDPVTSNTSIEGTLGEGNGTVTAQTTNGDVDIHGFTSAPAP